MNTFDLARSRMLAAWQWESARLCPEDAMAELAGTISAMRQIAALERNNRTWALALAGDVREDDGPPAARTTDGPD